MDPELAPHSPSSERLALYYRENCWFCSQVRAVATARGVALELRDIRADPRWRLELVQATGSATVPVLLIANSGQPPIWLAESEAIATYLRSRRLVRSSLWRRLFVLLPWPLVAAAVFAERSVGLACLAGALLLIALRFLLQRQRLKS